MTEEQKAGRKLETLGNKFSRRELLVGAGGFAAGAALGATLGSGALDLLPKAKAAGEPEVPAWPWPYKKLDPAAVSKLGYQSYYEGGCMYGAAKAILLELRDKVGYPYNMVPLDMFRYGEGGMVGWGTLCGALNGAAAILTLVSGKPVYPKLVNELLGWYSGEPFPSKKHDQYAKFPDEVQNVSGSPLCHVSVTEWCKHSGFKVTDPQRLDRCAKLTGDVAARAVEMLNLQADGSFIAAYKPSDLFAGCMSCHVGKDSALNNVQGRMDCVQCHDDPHKK